MHLEAWTRGKAFYSACFRFNRRNRAIDFILNGPRWLLWPNPSSLFRGWDWHYYVNIFWQRESSQYTLGQQNKKQITLSAASAIVTLYRYDVAPQTHHYYPTRGCTESYLETILSLFLFTNKSKNESKNESKRELEHVSQLILAYLVHPDDTTIREACWSRRDTPDQQELISCLQRCSLPANCRGDLVCDSDSSIMEGAIPCGSFFLNLPDLKHARRINFWIRDQSWLPLKKGKKGEKGEKGEKEHEYFGRHQTKMCDSKCLAHANEHKIQRQRIVSAMMEQIPDYPDLSLLLEKANKRKGHFKNHKTHKNNKNNKKRRKH